MPKVEVRIRYCCCCSLTVAAILIAIYTIVVFSVFLGLASWSLSRLVQGVPDPAENCGPGYSLRPNDNTVIIIDPYFCTLGWYTEELKYTGVRYPVLVINIVLFILLILSAVLIFIAVFLHIPWLLLPWIGLMCLEIIRGTISCVLIFVYAHNASEIIKPIATGIFFLGLQFFHLSLVLIMVARFQTMLDKIRGVVYRVEPKSDKSVLVDGNQVVYPPGPGNVVYAASPNVRRDPGYYQPSYNTYQPGDSMRIHQRAPSELAPSSRPYYGQGPSGYNTAYGTHHSRQTTNVGRTM